MTDITQAIHDLIKSGKDLAQDNLDTPTLVTFEVKEEALSLTNKAKDAINNKAYTTVHQYNEKTGPAKSKYYEDDSHLASVLRLLELLDAITPSDIMMQNGPSYIRRTALANYFGIRCKPVDATKAVAKICDLINDLAEDDAIKCALAKPLFIPMADGSLIIVTYLNIKDDKQSLVEQKYKNLIFEEGKIPADL